MIINVKVTPRASKTELIQISDTIYKAKLTAVPEKGKANDQLLELLSEKLNIPKTKLSIKAGKTSRDKLIEIK
jgi:hypothetical protein